jgi:hypothetical protein
MSYVITRKILIVAAAIACLSIAACGQMDRGVANLTGHSEQCIDGVKYVQFSSGASVKYKKDSTVDTCN